MGKIFGLGLERTGTVSLTLAMSRLGYTTFHMPRSTNEIDPVDFVSDITVACRFEYLDRRYPGSKFILTTRDEESWLKSCRQHYKNLEDQGVRDFTGEAAAEILYGSTFFIDDLWLWGYTKHTKHVLEYFANRENDLLIFDIFAGDSWDKLLKFVPFPHENRGNYHVDQE